MTSRVNQGITRREAIKAAGTLAAIAATGAPAISIAQPAPIRVGVLHAVTGPLAYSGNQGRLGVVMAIEDINKAGGIKSLGGAKIDAVLADARSRPDVGAAEVERLNEAGVTAIVGPFVSSIALAATEAASRHSIPFVVDVGVVDAIVERGLKNTFRFGPGLHTIVATAIDGLTTVNDAAGKPAKRVMIIHEESAFGSGMAKTLNRELPSRGFEIVSTLSHPNPTRDFTNIVLKIKAEKPDLIIPSNYYDEYVLLMRTLHQQQVRVKGVYSILGGAANNQRFIREFPAESNLIMDCGHWVDEKNPKAQHLMKEVAGRKAEFTLELFMAYTATMFLADALERGATRKREDVIQALASSQWSGHFMPYGPTKIVNGQNTGSRPVITQIIDRSVKIVYPSEYSNAKPLFMKM